MAEFQVIHLVNAIVFALLGIVILAVSFVVVDKLTPYDLWKELVENKNVALAVLLGAMSIGMSMIIAASVH